MILWWKLNQVICSQVEGYFNLEAIGDIHGEVILKLLVTSRKVLCLVHAFRFLMLDSHCAALCVPHLLWWNNRMRADCDPNTNLTRLYVTLDFFSPLLCYKLCIWSPCLCVCLLLAYWKFSHVSMPIPVLECCIIFQFLCGVWQVVDIWIETMSVTFHSETSCQAEASFLVSSQGLTPLINVPKESVHCNWGQVCVIG